MRFRNYSALFLVGVLFCTQAHASRARELVLGTGDAGVALNGGSLLFDDGYNVFYNPAYVNDFSRWGIIEKSNFPGGSAQGGVFDSIFLISYGVFLNRGNAIVTHPGLAGGERLPYALDPVRPFEFFLGGDWGFKWGLGLTYSGSKTNVGSSNDLSFHLGAIIDSFEPFLTLKPKGTEPGKEHYFYRAGLRYRWGEWIPYFVIATAGDREIDAASPRSLKEITYGFGLTRSTRVSEGVKMNYGTGFYKVADSGGNTTGERKILPLDISFEGNLTDWAVLLGGISYNLMDRLNGISAPDTTTGRIGARLSSERTSVEWAFGKTLPDAAQEQGDIADAQNIDLNHGFFTALNLSYRW